MPRIVVFLQHPNNFVRSAAINVCMSCYKFSGSSIEPYFSNLRPALKELLHAGFLEVEDEKRRESKLPGTPTQRVSVTWAETDHTTGPVSKSSDDFRLNTPDLLPAKSKIKDKARTTSRSSAYVVKPLQNAEEEDLEETQPKVVNLDEKQTGRESNHGSKSAENVSQKKPEKRVQNDITSIHISNSKNEGEHFAKDSSTDSVHENSVSNGAETPTPTRDNEDSTPGQDVEGESDKTEDSKKCVIS